MATSYFNMGYPWYSFVNVPANGYRTIQFANSTRALVLTIGASAEVQTMWIVAVSSGGSITYSAVKSGSYITASSPDTNQFRLSNSAGNINPNLYVLCWTGTATKLD